MIAHYGYQDGSGAYYISIDTERCVTCSNAHACIAACPQQVFELITDDYDEQVIAVRADKSRQLASLCSACKSAPAEAGLPCTAACAEGAIEHSW